MATFVTKHIPQFDYAATFDNLQNRVDLWSHVIQEMVILSQFAISDKSNTEWEMVERGIRSAKNRNHVADLRASLCKHMTEGKLQIPAGLEHHKRDIAAYLNVCLNPHNKPAQVVVKEVLVEIAVAAEMKIKKDEHGQRLTLFAEKERDMLSRLGKQQKPDAFMIAALEQALECHEFDEEGGQALCSFHPTIQRVASFEAQCLASEVTAKIYNWIQGKDKLGLGL